MKCCYDSQELVVFTKNGVLLEGSIEEIRSKLHGGHMGDGCEIFDPCTKLLSPEAGVVFAFEACVSHILYYFIKMILQKNFPPCGQKISSNSFCIFEW